VSADMHEVARQATTATSIAIQNPPPVSSYGSKRPVSTVFRNGLIPGMLGKSLRRNLPYMRNSSPAFPRSN